MELISHYVLHAYFSEAPCALGLFGKGQDLWIVAGLGNLFLSLEEVTHYD